MIRFVLLPFALMMALTHTSMANETHAKHILSRSLVIDGELSLRENANGEVPTSSGGIKKKTNIDVGFWTYDADSIERVGKWIRKNPEIFILISKASDLDEVKKTKKFGILLFLENPGAASTAGELKASLSIPTLKEQGLRVFQLAYGPNSDYGGGFLDDHALLTPSGKKLIQELNQLGIIIDLSHVGKKTTLETAALSSLPVIAGHSNAEFLAPHARNKSDEELKAIAKTGGVVGVTPIAAYLKKNANHQPGLSDFIEQIDYLVKLIGIDHVSLGSDSYLDGSTAQGFELAGDQLASRDRWSYVVQALIKKGYSDADIEKILGLNLKRVISAHLK